MKLDLTSRKIWLLKEMLKLAPRERTEIALAKRYVAEFKRDKEYTRAEAANVNRMLKELAQKGYVKKVGNYQGCYYLVSKKYIAKLKASEQILKDFI